MKKAPNHNETDNGDIMVPQRKADSDTCPFRETEDIKQIVTLAPSEKQKAIKQKRYKEDKDVCPFRKAEDALSKKQEARNLSLPHVLIISVHLLGQ